ncbi:coiled-coil domain-containing protein 25 isoform X1 [Juglans microcarpa x Juglans regia]|uniref:coiled-coil domain-containing protein 25 isoform X1 n=1 Tax=Juglans microcarpa x Juglans regia TaxID=2249226 RepID=UPI001B7F7352|nr:coiled-coil domain-containing protein 25 isoform X1 [Juglans microcarpa x Juglans regia]
MVFYFKARPDAGDFTIFMGIDKYENEELIKYGFLEDIWFHVDKMSSAHVYLRLHKGQTIDDISEGLLEDCAQLVKANSIQGNKVNNVDVVYTPWSNLKKSASMDVGQVGFYNPKMVRTVRVEKRINDIVNRLNRTKVERRPDLKGTIMTQLPPRILLASTCSSNYSCCSLWWNWHSSFGWVLFLSRIVCNFSIYHVFPYMHGNSDWIYSDFKSYLNIL